MRFEVLSAVAMKITVLWDVTEYSLVDVCPTFLRNVDKYHTIRRHILKYTIFLSLSEMFRDPENMV
jgi:hypothetical protein